MLGKRNRKIDEEWVKEQILKMPKPEQSALKVELKTENLVQGPGIQFDETFVCCVCSLTAWEPLECKECEEVVCSGCKDKCFKKDNL